MNKGATLFMAILSSSMIAGCQSVDPLQFPKDHYTVETKTVMTSDGEKTVTYHAYMHLLYVANPVDTDYQSLNVSVPVEIDGHAVDASDAPILFVIGVGGYMSVNNTGSGRGEVQGRQRGQGNAGGNSPGSREDLALAAGYVIVTPGCRGRDNQAADGTWYGKAPAAIVDLKAAVRYIRHNAGIMPGNVDHIVSVGCSAGGALSSLLAASGNSPEYDPYLAEIGAADEGDDIFACGAYSPIIDLEHADMAYEWNYGTTPTRTGLVDQELSARLRTAFAGYQASLALEGREDYGALTADNYQDYLLKFYLIPSANKYLGELTMEARDAYLANNPWITWTDQGVTFGFEDYVAHVGRMKGLPAFDDFNMQQPEPNLFGNETTAARHFTDFSLRQSTGDPDAAIDDEVKTLVNLMNPMYFIGLENTGCSNFWWLRNGTGDNHTSQTVMVNLATSLENQGRKLNAWVFWDGGHCADDDPEGFVIWIGQITGYSE